jgi:hypothetical protein
MTDGVTVYSGSMSAKVKILSLSLSLTHKHTHKTEKLNKTHKDYQYMLKTVDLIERKYHSSQSQCNKQPTTTSYQIQEFKITTKL